MIKAVAMALVAFAAGCAEDSSLQAVAVSEPNESQIDAAAATALRSAPVSRPYTHGSQEAARTWGEHEWYICHEGDEQCVDSNLSASTADEADWLSRNGFPSLLELERLGQASVEQLEAEASNNEAATLELARRYSGEGDFHKALELSLPLARSGNIFAYHSLSEIYGTSGPKQDLIEAGAYLRLAQMLGDHNASKLLARRFPNFGPTENVMVDRRATSLYQTLADNRAPDPRP